MDKAENKGLKIENISIDSNSVKQLTIEEQILMISENEEVMREKNNASNFLDELETRTTEDLKLGNIEVGTIGEVENNKNESDREDR